jgi:heat shock 70kDa protein 1/2/6/8
MCRMSMDDIERAIQESERYKAQDEANKARIEAKNSLENYVYQICNTLTDERTRDLLSETEIVEIEEAAREVTAWLEENQQGDVREYEAKQRDLEAIVRPFFARLCFPSLEHTRADFHIEEIE